MHATASRALMLSGTVLALCACADLPPTATVPMPSPNETWIAPEPEADPGWPVKIHSAETGIQLFYAGATATTQDAAADAWMTYDSYHARITPLVTVSGPKPVQLSFFPAEKHTAFAFFENRLAQQWDFTVSGTCGHTVRVDARFDVWFMGKVDAAISSEQAERWATRSQPTCATFTGGGGGGFGSPGTMKCYTETVDHYWYYPDTGVYEYRYTTEETWCEYYET